MISPISSADATDVKKGDAPARIAEIAVAKCTAG
jgi:hypothetical protein